MGGAHKGHGCIGRCSQCAFLTKLFFFCVGIRGVTMSAANAKSVLALFVLTVAAFVWPQRRVGGSFSILLYGALRGRMVDRDGLFHVSKYRWGNGLTPEGAAVLTHAIDAAATIVPEFVTGGAGRGSKSTSPSQPRSGKVGRRMPSSRSVPLTFC